MGIPSDTSARVAITRRPSSGNFWLRLTEKNTWRQPWLWGIVALGLISFLSVAPLGRAHSVNATIAASAFICGGLISWLSAPQCARLGHRRLLNGMRLTGILTALAGVALFNGQAMALDRSSYLVTMLISNVGGLICLHLWEERAKPHAMRPIARHAVTLWRVAFAINCVGIIAAPLWLARVLHDPNAFLLARIGPIALGLFSAIMLLAQSARAPQTDYANWIAVVGVAAQLFFIDSAPPFSLNWSIACALVLAQIALTYRGQMRQAMLAASEPPAWLALVAHDLKIPLNMLTFISSQIAYTIEKDGPLDQVSAYARRLQSSSHRFERFINLFLDFTGKQIDAPMRLRLESLDALALVRQVIADEQAVIANPVSLILAPPPGEPGGPLAEDQRVTWDKARIEAVLLNLLTNAVKFSQYGAPIEARLWQRDAGHLSIAIRDQGKGMTPETQAHLFEPYYRAPDSTAIQGHGLGLTMVKTIVEWHGGTIAVTNLPDPGVMITITLPMTVPTTAKAIS